MPENIRPAGHNPNREETGPDEGGLRAPPGLSLPGKIWWWFDFVILVNLARFRFIGILVLIGIVIMKWDTFVAYYERWTRPAQQEQAANADFEYFCPMHPTVIRDKPGEKCPICFMPLSKRKKGADQEAALPPGVVNRVQLSPYRIVLAGIQTWQVAYLPLAKEISTVGFVEFNERGLKQVAARVKGRLDTLYVNETGQMVHAGQVLASLYSPELVVTVQNLLDAQRSKNSDLLRSARDRLKLWGIGDDQIGEILRSGKANTHLNIQAPIGGHVLKKYVKEGQTVEEGSPLYDVADLSTVWIEAQVYEEDMAFLPGDLVSHQTGDVPRETFTAIATTQANPNEKFAGKLAFVYPHVDQETHTLMVRFELPNPGHKLRPGTTATVKLKLWPRHLELFSTTLGENWAKANAFELLSPSGRARPVGLASAVYTALGAANLFQGRVLAVPQSAVIDTGALKLVYREMAAGEFEGVSVDLGPRMVGPNDGVYYPVLHGLAVGDRVVTSGSFLVDAETRLNPAAGSIYFGGSSGASGAGSPTSNVRPSTPQDTEVKIKTALEKLPAEDRQLAQAQAFCPILKDSRLGLMGMPVRIVLDDKPVFLCCESCRKEAFADPKETLAKVETLKTRR